MTEQLERFKDHLQHLWCQHCKAQQKSNHMVIKCWYNSLDREAPAFCAANEDAINHILISKVGNRTLKELIEEVNNETDK